jgi:hypothetical protein
MVMRGSVCLRPRCPRRGVAASASPSFPGFLENAKNLFGRASGKGSLGKAKDKCMSKLLKSIGPTSRGTNQSKETRQEIMDCLAELKELAFEDPAVNQAQLNGTWRLVWTTEKEILGIIKEGGIANFFGTSAGDVLQVIDLQASRLQNCISFPPEGAFLVDSFIAFDEEDQKCSFKFSGAALKTDKWTVRLPPMGKSRFQTLYVNRTHRVAFDDRGDFLIVERVGAPRNLFAENGL